MITAGIWLVASVAYLSAAVVAARRLTWELACAHRRSKVADSQRYPSLYSGDWYGKYRVPEVEEAAQYPYLIASGLALGLVWPVTAWTLLVKPKSFARPPRSERADVRRLTEEIERLERDLAIGGDA